MAQPLIQFNQIAFLATFFEAQGINTREIGIKGLSIDTAQLAADAVDKTKIDADIAGLGLSQAVGGELDVNVSTGLVITGDNVLIDTGSTVTFAGATWTFPASNLQISTQPTAGAHAVNKTYVDNLALGLQWFAPVSTMGLVGNLAALDIEGLTPTAGDAYVVTTANGAGALTTAAIGDLWEYDGAAWNLIIAGSGGFVASGVRAVLNQSTTLVAPYAAADPGAVYAFSGSSLTGTEVAGQDVDGSALLNKGSLTGTGYLENNAFVYQGAEGAGVWVVFAGGSAYTGSEGVVLIGSDFRLNIASMSAGTIAAGDELAFNDVSTDPDSVDKKITLANLVDFMNGNGLSATSGVLAVVQDVTTGGNVVPVDVSVNGVGLDVDDIDGVGIAASGSGTLDLDIGSLTADSLATGDELVFNDISEASGTANKITIANFLSYLGSNLSLASHSVSATLGLQGTSYDGNPAVNDWGIKADSTTGATVAPLGLSASGAGVKVDNSTITHTTGTIAVAKTPAALTAGTGISAAGTFDGALARTFALDLNDLPTSTPDVSADFVPWVDASDNSSDKVSIANFVGAIAGVASTTGLTDTAGVLSLDINSLVATAIADGDFLAFADITDTNKPKKITAANLALYLAGEYAYEQEVKTNAVATWDMTYAFRDFKQVQVYRNGVRLKYVAATPSADLTEYVADNTGAGSVGQINLGAALPAGDELVIVYEYKAA